VLVAGELVIPLHKTPGSQLREWEHVGSLPHIVVLIFPFLVYGFGRFAD
jgi:hypothetical protein